MSGRLFLAVTGILSYMFAVWMLLSGGIKSGGQPAYWVDGRFLLIGKEILKITGGFHVKLQIA